MYDVIVVGARVAGAPTAMLLARKGYRGWRDRIEKDVRDWWQLMERRAMQDADPLNPQRVFHELSPRLPDGCILASGSGDGASMEGAA